MIKFFKYINRQPKSVRDNYALGIAATFTVMVLIVWVIANPNGISFTAEVATGSENETSPFSTLVKESKEKMVELKASLAGTNADSETQSAATMNSSSTDPSALVLSEDEIKAALKDLQNSTNTESTADKSNYTEVMIATTSVSVSSTKNCFETGSTTQGSSTSSDCFGRSVTASTTVE